MRTGSSLGSSSFPRAGSALLYVEAARSSRPGQLAGRIRRLIPPAVLATGCDRGTPASWRPLRARLLRDDAPQSGPTTPPHEDGRFVAFGHERQADRLDLWTDAGDGLLFLFHLHGFSDLFDFALSEEVTDARALFWAQLTDRWLLLHVRPSLPAWHPYPTSERLIAWCVALSRLPQWPAALRDRVAREIWRQACYLRRSFEHDIGGNHVLQNAVALCFAGAVLPTSRLSAVGIRLLEREVRSQFLPDGGHEERSTSYHRRLLRQLENVRAVLDEDGDGAPGWLGEAIERARDWQGALAGPDGTVPMLNDAWEGPAIGGPRRERMTILKESGLLVLRNGTDQLIIDSGQLCPPHLPPHAHADALSFVLWWDGAPLLVDPGAFAYTGPCRDAFRATSAHSTVAVDGDDQCVFWGDFRASRLPHVRFERPEQIGDVVVVRASHDGYRRLRDPVVHQRTFAWLPGDGVVIVDLLTCRATHRIESALRAAPGTKVAADRVGPLRVRALRTAAAPLPEVVAMPYAPFLGTLLEAQALRITRSVQPHEPFGWSLLREGLPEPVLTTRTVTAFTAAGHVKIPLDPLPQPNAR